MSPLLTFGTRSLAIAWFFVCHWTKLVSDVRQLILCPRLPLTWVTL